MIGDRIYALITDLFDINRSITGDGVRKTLSIIKKYHIPEFNIYEIESQTVVEDWMVPDEWNVKSAYIESLDGRRVVDFSNNNLHLMGYSIPVDKIVNLDELNEHLYSLPEMPDAIPYVTSYYRRDWGFCISDNDRNKLNQDEYRVFIDSELSKGGLTYADIVIPGSSNEEIFFTTYICHPSMANNELSGPGLAALLAEKISKTNNRYTYRFVFAPETIGSIVYISKNKLSLKRNVKVAFNLTCVGDDRAFSFMPSRKGDSLADKIAQHVLKHKVDEYDSYNFMRDRGSDERQYCSPGVDLPMVSIMRSKYGSYPEYHTSLDNMDLISSSGLSESYNIHMQCIMILENNYFYKARYCGEPFLSKHGMNFKIVGGKENDESITAQNVLNVIMCCDGSKDVIDIAEELGQYAGDLISIFGYLKEEGLLEKI